MGTLKVNRITGMTGVTGQEPIVMSGDTVSLGNNEGFGRVLIESMLNKSLVIATSGGGHNEIISNGDNGVIIESNNKKVIARKILFYIENTAITKKITDNAFIYSKKNFVENNTPKHIEKIYENIL